MLFRSKDEAPRIVEELGSSHVMIMRNHGLLTVGRTLGEGFTYGPDGQLLTLTLLDYGKATARETPHIEVEHCPIPDPFTTLGQKAAGEGAAIPSPACIAGAIEDALKPLGITIRQLPISPERVWQMIQEAQGARASR